MFFWSSVGSRHTGTRMLLPAHAFLTPVALLMHSQTVISVLSDCGDNIDAAIKRLSELRLTNAGRMVPDEAPSGWSCNLPGWSCMVPDWHDCTLALCSMRSLLHALPRSHSRGAHIASHA